MPAILRIGLVSDTHGLLRPEALEFLAGCEHIVHAGDIVDPSILERLALLAPLTAVRGNNDHGDWAGRLPEAASVRLGGVMVHVLHDLAQLAIDTRSAGVQVVVSGHSHRPRIDRRADGVLYVNPGSCGPRRFSLPVSAAELLIVGGAATARVVELLSPSAASRAATAR